MGGGVKVWCGERAASGRVASSAAQCCVLRDLACGIALGVGAAPQARWYIVCPKHAPLQEVRKSNGRPLRTPLLHSIWYTL